MAKKTTTETPVPEQNQATADLAAALVQAIQIARPIEKKTILNRKENSPWTPPDGSKKLKLKRKVTLHGRLVDPDFVSNEEIALLNELKPGSYLKNWVKVSRRKDGGIEIDYPFSTVAQRMRLASEFRVFNFEDLVGKCIAEAKDRIARGPKTNLDDLGYSE